MNDEVRSEAIKRSVEALDEARETLRIPWKEGIIHAPVIKIAVSSLVLNPRSHRIKAQLESDPRISALIESDPYGDDVQVAIANLLRATPNFGDLKGSLEAESQKEPGIITSYGLLINANCRAVALGDIGSEYIDVAVLPNDATIGELYDLELSLQVAHDYRQPYSFTNELLFVDDLVLKSDRSEEEVAQRLQWIIPGRTATTVSGVQKVKRYVRHLAFIRELQKLSGKNIPLTDFDSTEQALQEFDKEYEKFRARDPLGAERMKQARMLALLVGLGYDRMRQIDSEWVDNYFVDALCESDILGPLIEPMRQAATSSTLEPVADLGDVGLFEDDPTDDSVANHELVKYLVSVLAKSSGADSVTLPTNEGEKKFDREQIGQAVNELMRNAAEDAKMAARAGSDLALPLTLVNDASKKLQRARDAYLTVMKKDGFNKREFLEAVGVVSRCLEGLNVAVKGE
jgi:hypothetical protein